MDLSNKSLALLLLAAVVISLGGTMISLNRLSQFQVAGGDLGITGMQTSPTGTTELTVNSTVSCAVDTNVNFGALEAQTLQIDTETNNSASVGSLNDCTDATTLSGTDCEGMTVNNTGNEDLVVNFTSDSAASGFLGGNSVASSDFQVQMANGTAWDSTEEGCVDTASSTWGAWQDVNTSGYTVCNNLTPTTSSDAMTAEYRVQVKDDTPAGDKTATITFDCDQA